MKLDLNFSKLTKLRDWWKQVYNNFKIIETECSETRVIAESALTSQEAREYMTEFINSTPENMAAIEAFTALLEKHGDSTAALEEVFSDRLRYYAHDSELDADLVTELYDGIHFCKSGTLNTPANGNGILLNFKGVCQYWLSVDGKVYSRQYGADWIKSDKTVNDRIYALNEELSSMQKAKSEILFGTYVGNGEEDRFINLGFTPVAVEVYRADGWQAADVMGGNRTISGGLALTGKPCVYSGHTIVGITSGGFNVSLKSTTDTFIRSNSSNVVYYFIAFKNGEIMEVS